MSQEEVFKLLKNRPTKLYSAQEVSIEIKKPQNQCSKALGRLHKHKQVVRYLIYKIQIKKKYLFYYSVNLNEKYKENISESNNNKKVNIKYFVTLPKHKREET